MALSKGFQFKQFFIAHDQCAMKVNTDGILLGAIADVSNAQQILDLGTGSGLIAIMLAQRTACEVEITGIELEKAAYHQAVQNVENSPWANKVRILQADLFQQDFANKFDLIVANPPYFEHSLTSKTSTRDLARKVNQSHLDWLKQARKWLSLTGKISFILPIEAAEKLVEQAPSVGLCCTEKWSICTKVGKLPKRMLVVFETSPNKNCVEQWLTIYQANNQYTAQFIQMTQAFYLKH